MLLNLKYGYILTGKVAVTAKGVIGGHYLAVAQIGDSQAHLPLLKAALPAQVEQIVARIAVLPASR